MKTRKTKRVLPREIKKKQLCKIAVVIHVYYLDQVVGILDYISNINYKYKIFFTTPEEKKLRLFEILDKYKTKNFDVIVFPNQGYDVAPFIRLLPSLKKGKYDLVCKIHTKKGPEHLEIFKYWFDRLMQPILGSEEITNTIITVFEENKSLGMLGCADFYKSAQGLMYGNEKPVEKILCTLDGNFDASSEWGFFAGTIFWARLNVFSPILNNTKLNQLINDNTSLKMESGIPVSVFHALERVFGVLPSIMGMSIGVSRINEDGSCKIDVLPEDFVPSRKAIQATLEEKQMKQAIIILGMHRSGTSALAGLVSLFGYNPGSDLMKPSKANPKGYFENNKVVKLNDAILEEHHASWRDFSFTVDEISLEKKAEYVVHAKEIILGQGEDKQLSLIKDPRMCLLFPIWAQAFKELDIPLKIIVAYRDPVEVAQSLFNRTNSDNLAYEHSFMLWEHSLYQLELHSRGYTRLFVHYTKDFEKLNVLLARLGEFTGRKVTDELLNSATDFYSPSLNHYQTDTLEKQFKLPKALMRLANLLCTSGVSSFDDFDKIRKNFYRSKRYFVACKELQNKKIRLLAKDVLIAYQDNDKLKDQLQKVSDEEKENKKELDQKQQELSSLQEEVRRLQLEMSRQQATYIDYQKKVLIELDHKTSCLSLSENKYEIANSLVSRVVNDSTYSNKIKKNIFGYPRYELKKLVQYISNDKAKNQLQYEKALIAESGLFSPVYYLTHNPDIWRLGYDPLDSYCKTGWKEARRPGSGFDPVFYWMSHPEVPRNINPLIHYIREGKAQGLAPYGLSHFLEREIPSELLVESGFSCSQVYKYSNKNIPQVDFVDDVLVSILVLNRNGVSYLQTLLPMLYENTQGIHYEVIVVDNDSDDHSVFYLENLNLDIPLTIIKNKKNESFSYANNQAAQKAKGKYLVLLNNDVEPTKGWLNYLLDEFQADPNTGSVGAKLVYPFKYSFPKSCSIQHAGIAFRYEGDFFRPYNMGNGKCIDDVVVSKSQQRSTLTAACLLVSKEAYFDVGGLDERYLYGYEDVDLGLKLYKKGYVNRYAANALLFHHEFGTQDKDDQDDVVKRRLKNLDIFKSKWQRFIKQAYWQEKLNWGTNLFAETILHIVIIVNASDDQDKKAGLLTTALEKLSWQVSVVNEEINQLPEHVDVVISLSSCFDINKIHITNKRLIKIAWIQEHYDVWRENSSFDLYNHIFVSNELKAELKPYDNEPQNTSGSITTTRLVRYTDKQLGQSLYSCLNHHYVTPSIAIKVPAPSWNGIQPWGDYHVAVMLKKSLEKEGYRVVLQVLSEWYNDEADACDVALVLRGLERYEPKPHQINIMWNISHPDMISLDEYEDYDVVCIASDYWAKELKQKLTVPVEVVHQCTDTARFSPPTKGEQEQNHQELLFVGNSRGVYRKILKDLLPTDYDLKVIGGGWKGLIPHKYWPASYLDNKELSKHYGSADILLNDHWDDMREKGFVSNRLYDGLASGAFIISDKVRDMGEINDYICTYETANELSELIEYYLNHPEKRKEKVNEALVYIQRNHTFDNRAKQFSKLIKILSKKDCNGSL